MDWIKRNLYFVIGAVVALVLMGLAGWFFYSKWTLNNENLAKLNADYAELGRLNSQQPHPGSDKVNNIQTAKEEQQQVRKMIENCRKHFQRIAPIPDVPKVTDQDFAGALSRTIAQLQRDATNASVILPANYNFSFEAQKPRVSFAPGSLAPLSVQLGETKAICDALFQAKINALVSLRRERVSADDNTGPLTDYLGEKSVTNELAVLTPYELTFNCFSTELAGVLAAFGSSPYGFIIKTLNVEPAPAAAATEPGMPTPFAYTPPIAAPAPVMSPTINAAEAGESAAYARRYGMGPGARGSGRYGGEGRYGGGGANLGGIPLREYTAPAPAPVPAYAVPGTPAAPLPARGGMPTVLDEKQLKVTMALYLVKLLPAK